MGSTVSLVVGTRNPGKLAEYERLLRGGAWPLLSLADFPDVAEADESADSLSENARRKATCYAAQLRQWVLADDTGLLVDALGGAPGTRSARFAGPRATAEDNRRRLLAALDGVRTELRTARFVCHMVLADPSCAVRAECQGICRGRIRREPAGQRGFGYDCLLEIVEYHRTLAELGDAAQSCLSHRARAVEAMRLELARLLGREA